MDSWRVGKPPRSGRVTGRLCVWGLLSAHQIISFWARRLGFGLRNGRLREATSRGVRHLLANLRTNQPTSPVGFSEAGTAASMLRLFCCCSLFPPTSFSAWLFCGSSETSPAQEKRPNSRPARMYQMRDQRCEIRQLGTQPARFPLSDGHSSPPPPNPSTHHNPCPTQPSPAR